MTWDTGFLARLGEFVLDAASGPLHAQIADVLASAIDDGRLEPGERLPPERELAAQLQVSRMTLRQALDSLERRGVLRRAVGRSGGTFVSERKVRRDLSHYAGLADQLRTQHIEVSAQVLESFRRGASPAIASALKLPVGEPVFEIARVRIAAGRPVALERTNYPEARYPGLLEHPLDGSIYDLLRTEYGGVPESAVEYLEPIAAGPEEVAALHVPSGAPLMNVERIAFDRDGQPVEFSRDIFRGDRTRMVVYSNDLR